MKRNATAVWNGTGKEGKGHLTTNSKVLNEISYNYRQRFEDEPGTNPEELIAAAHASCFAMKLAFVLNEGGFTPDSLQARSEVTFEGGVVKSSHLVVEGKVPGIDEQKFQEAVKNAEQNCPISKLLSAGLTISSEAKLIS